MNLNSGFQSVTLFVGAQTTGTTAPFRSASAANLASISFDARGIDSGVMGWDEIAVERLSDK